MTSSHETIRDLIPVALRLADAAAEVTVRHFRSASLSADNKLDDGFDPVTVADKGSETAMRAVLSAERPDDGVFGEEQERTYGSSGYTWVLDPIDGTRAYISGLPVWGTLIALDDGDMGRIGIIDQPYIGERFVGILDGSGSEAWLQRGGVRAAISVRQGRALSEAILFTTDADIFKGSEVEAFAEVRSKAQLTRYGTDCYAYALLAMGQVDLVIESGLAAYDIASHIPLIHAAGGIVTDWKGGDCRWGGRILAAGSADLHAEALGILSKAS